MIALDLILLPWLISTSLSPQGAVAEEPIVTDRPDFTESSLAVPRGSLQIESGFTFARDGGGMRSFGGPEILGRYGIADRLELRFGLPNYNWIDSQPRTEGLDDTYLGAKIQLGPAAGFDFALIPAVFIPSGRPQTRSEAAAPEIKVVWGRDVGNGRSLTGMVYVASIEENGRRRTPVQHTISLGLPVADRTGMFLEHVLDARADLRPAHTIHSGFTYQPNASSQFDIHYGLGLSPGAPDFFIGAGYSIRF